jgi:V/A-type H+-transporting ATPase subunit B
MRRLEFQSAHRVEGGLLYMRQVEGVAYGDHVLIKDSQGNRRNGQVIKTSNEMVLVQILESTDDLSLDNTWVRFLDQPYELSLSPDIMGRVFSGIGQPRDGRPPIISADYFDINGSSMNPASRSYPKEFIQTGISTIDGLNSLVRGQKLPIFSGSGLPHNRLLAQIVRQVKLLGEESDFSIVFAAMGISHADAHFFESDFETNGVLGNVVMYMNHADDPPLERLSLPRAALTAAEYLAFELDRHVLVLMTDMTNYAEALREVATAKGDVPTRKGYPGYLYSDLAEIYERSGRIDGKAGSITLVPVVSMPSDDITHPIPDLTGYITEGQIVLSRELHNAGIYPPVNVLPSLSRLMKDGIGKGDTREDHPRVANQLYALYAKSQEIRNLASIIGKEELGQMDQRYLKFADEFDRNFIGQAEDDDRTIEDTLTIAWDLLSLFPADTLIRVNENDVKTWHNQDNDEEQAA